MPTVLDRLEKVVDFWGDESQPLYYQLRNFIEEEREKADADVRESTPGEGVSS